LNPVSLHNTPLMSHVNLVQKIHLPITNRDIQNTTFHE